jgi:hypothetical protein
MTKRKLPEVLKPTVFKPGHRYFPRKERDPEYVPGRGHFHSEALRMARAMTPAAIRRLGEFAGINPDTGELIPLEKVDVDHRVMQISCLALVERTMGKAKEMPDKPQREVLAEMSDEEVALHTAELLIESGMPRATALGFVRRSLKLDKEREDFDRRRTAAVPEAGAGRLGPGAARPGLKRTLAPFTSECLPAA